MQRRRSSPRRSSLQWSGVLPYMTVRKSCQWGPASTFSTSWARSRAWSYSHSGSRPACTIRKSPWRRAKGRVRSQSMSSAPSGALRMGSRVSPARGLRMPANWASRCRSWLPSTVRARRPSLRISRRVPRESGPRLTRSPQNQRVSVGAGPIFLSSCSRGWRQPCRSPKASVTGVPVGWGRGRSVPAFAPTAAPGGLAAWRRAGSGGGAVVAAFVAGSVFAACAVVAGAATVFVVV